VAAGCGRSSSSLLLLRYLFSLFSHLASLLLLPSDGSKSKVGGGSVVSNGGERDQRERLQFFSSPLFSFFLFCRVSHLSMVFRSKKKLLPSLFFFPLSFQKEKTHSLSISRSKKLPLSFVSSSTIVLVLRAVFIGKRGDYCH